MLDSTLIQKTLRVPTPAGKPGDGAAAARQFDAALMSVGFKASGQLLAHLSGLHPDAVINTAVHALGAVRELVGDHHTHNVYFRDFPRNVPNTVEFWLERLAAAAVVDREAAGTSPLMLGGINLLALPGYGTYQHTYLEMLAAHDEFLPTVADRVTVLHLGADLDAEARAVYADLAGSTTPLSENDLQLIELLAAWCVDGDQPAAIPVRENRALINRVRLANDKPLLVDTVTDVLRLACALSGGDVTLKEPTRFRSMTPRWTRRALLAALDDVVAANPNKLADVAAYREQWKRLGERLHPQEYPQLPHATEVFAVARGERTVRSLASRLDDAFDRSDIHRAVGLLTNAPGLLFRNLDRLVRAADTAGLDLLRKTVHATVGDVSGRVLLSVREHLDNRTGPDAARVFVNRDGRAWVTPDQRRPLDAAAVSELTTIIDDELGRRMPALENLVVDPAIYDVAVPLSGKTTASGFRIMPRGSHTPIAGDRVRFFVYWREQQSRTDFDLSALLLDDEFNNVGWLSYTSLSGYGGAHSGDITSAPYGASEFIDIDLARVPARYIVPQVNVYSGEGFDEVAESFFGFMTQVDGQRGKPFEPRTVRMRSDIRGAGRVALPMVFARGEDGSWSAKWLHLFLRGASWRNEVETNRLSTALLARSIVERQYLPVRHLVDLLRAKANTVAEYREGVGLEGPVTFIGLEEPEGLPAGSEVYTLDRLNALVPA